MSFFEEVKQYKTRTIARDMMIGLSSAIVSLISLVGIIYYFYSSVSYEQKLNSDVMQITEELASLLTKPVWLMDYDAVMNIFQAYRKSENLVSMRVEDSRGNVIFQSDLSDSSESITRSRIITSSQTGAEIGSVKLIFSTEHYKQTRKIMILTVIAISFLVIITIVFGTHFIMKYLLSRPLGQLIDGIRTIADGDYRNSLCPVPQQDINTIVNEINMMSEKISMRTTALAESEKKYRSIFENAMEGIFQTTPEGRFITANPATARIFGYDSPDELMNRVSNTRNIYTDPQERDEIVRILREKDSILNAEHRLYRKDGKMIWVSVQLRALRDDGGRLIRIDGIAWDITEKKALQEESMRQARLASIGELSAGVVHEINNPLNCIIGYAQILGDRAAKESEESNLAERIMKDSIRIERIVKSLLSFARERKEKKCLADIQTILSEALCLTQAHLKKDRISVNTDIPDNLLNIKANAQQIQQVFLNLISNARYALNLKYPESDPDKIIEIKAESLNKDGMDIIRIMFADRGTGIASDISDRICEPFFTTKPPNKGTGLGLSISHGIILDHQGKLWFESVQGEYTKAFVELPEYNEK